MVVRNRDDFSEPVKRVVAQRVNYCCSNPGCGAQTGGPQSDQSKALNLGVAAHIAAAAPDGPRYDANQSEEMRKGTENAIWLCQNCAKLIDNDSARFPASLLQDWKRRAEQSASDRIGKPSSVEPPIPIGDKWVSMPYVEKAGIPEEQRKLGYECRWSSAKYEAERVDIDGWERVIFTERDGTRCYLKIKDPTAGGYMILLRRKL